MVLSVHLVKQIAAAFEHRGGLCSFYNSFPAILGRYWFGFKLLMQQVVKSKLSSLLCVFTTLVAIFYYHYLHFPTNIRKKSPNIMPHFQIK